MKLGLIVPGGFDPMGAHGTIPALVGLASELARRHQVHVFAAAGRAGPGRYQLGDIDVTQLGPAGRFGALQLAAEFARWVRSTGSVDVLHAFWANTAALLMAAFSRARGRPSVVSVGGGELVWLADIAYGGAGTARGRAIARAALSMANAVTAGSRYGARALASGVACRAQIVPLGVDVALFRAEPSRPPGPPWRLLHVGSLNHVKDQPSILAALQRVIHRLGEVHLDCVGEDTLGGEIQRRARAMGLGARVAFHGFLPPERLAAFYRQAHLHVMASRHESQGVAILEAAAAGLPTVGTPVGLIDELAPNAACAVSPGDTIALGDAISGLLTDVAAREAMGGAAQSFARIHDIVWTARRFEAIYEHVLRGS